MKMDGLNHPKTKELAFDLEIPLPHAIGLLELLWAFVAQQTPRGNVGKWSDQVIASESGWQGDAGQFVQSLVSVGFLDEDDDHRLLVHDWDEHCPNWVRAKLKRKDQSLLSGDLSTDLRVPTGSSSTPTTSLAKPSQVKSKDSPNGERELPDGKTPTPHQEIVKLYHSLCPHLASVIKLSPARRQALRARWQNELTSLGHWETYFDTVAKSDFLSGRANPRPGGDRPFQADFDWLIKQANCIKVMEGKYD